MQIVQFNNGLRALFLQWRHRLIKTIKKTGKPVIRHLYLLFISSIVLINPSLSHAQSQERYDEQNVTMDGSRHANQSHTILIMGDSLSAAYGMDTKQGWVHLLAERYPQLNVINASISGETSSGGKQRLANLMRTYQPNVMVLELGANDALRGQNLRQTRDNLQQMIHACQDANYGCQTILLGIQLPTNYGPAYDGMLQKMYRDLATKNQLLFDPFFLETVALDPELMQDDGLHPNVNAQPVILQRLMPLFNQVQPSPR